ncbi:hypothetical protein TWF730_000475 [Orbilia blumenaviensis]|uniref:Uncharacterized protein n=1 Tax=Orbilia blumenaviensis TaxID=1796055 RepID=A0AAV9VPT4_9PEZI
MSIQRGDASRNGVRLHPDDKALSPSASNIGQCNFTEKVQLDDVGFAEKSLELLTRQEIYKKLIETLPKDPPLLKPKRLHSRVIRRAIMGLKLHPVREATLHVLNNDIESAEISMDNYFSALHCESCQPPEVWMLRSVLGRLKKDFANCDEMNQWYQAESTKALMAPAWPWCRDLEAPKPNSVSCLVCKVEQEAHSLRTPNSYENVLMIRKTLNYEWTVLFQWCETKYWHSDGIMPLWAIGPTWLQWTKKSWYENSLVMRPLIPNQSCFLKEY